MHTAGSGWTGQLALLHHVCLCIDHRDTSLCLSVCPGREIISQPRAVGRSEVQEALPGCGFQSVEDLNTCDNRRKKAASAFRLRCQNVGFFLPFLLK